MLITDKTGNLVEFNSNLDISKKYLDELNSIYETTKEGEKTLITPVYKDVLVSDRKDINAKVINLIMQNHNFKGEIKSLKDCKLEQIEYQKDLSEEEQIEIVINDGDENKLFITDIIDLGEVKIEEPPSEVDLLKKDNLELSNLILKQQIELELIKGGIQ